VSATELFDAIRTGNFAAVKTLLDADPSLASAKNDSGVSAVLMSMYNGRREIQDLLLSQGPALELHDAAAVGKMDVVKRIIENGSTHAKSFSPDGFPVVALAAVFGRLDVVRYLADHGAEVNASAANGGGYNALTGAVASGHTEIVRWLLQNGANPNHRYGTGYSPLLTAAANGHFEIVKLLLTHGADLHATTNDGKSAVSLATERSHPAVVEFLHSYQPLTRPETP
jgi:ankyrin repeat protein